MRGEFAIKGVFLQMSMQKRHHYPRKPDPASNRQPKISSIENITLWQYIHS